MPPKYSEKVIGDEGETSLGMAKFGCIVGGCDVLWVGSVEAVVVCVRIRPLRIDDDFKVVVVL